MPEYGGGLGVPSTFVEYMKHQLDHLNGANGPNEFALKTNGVFFYNGIVVMHRRNTNVPTSYAESKGTMRI
jgi:hypothetical protein